MPNAFGCFGMARGKKPDGVENYDFHSNLTILTSANAKKTIGGTAEDRKSVV